jgi:hypothetical protein
MPHRRLAAVALFLFSACGGSGGGSAGGLRSPQPASLTVAPAIAELTSGGAPVTFSATLSGTSAPIIWALTGPGSLSATSGPSIRYTPPATLSADTEATLLVAAGDVRARANIRLARASGILVTGRVVDFFGIPVSDVDVRIGTQTTTTDVSGQFALGNVSIPYVLVASSVEQQLAVIYQGLTRPDPTIFWRGSSTTPDRAGVVQGAITGGAPSSTAGVFTMLGWTSPEAMTQSFTFNGRYSLPFRWSGAQATTGSVRVLQVNTDAQGLPTVFPGYGAHRGVTVGDGSTVSSIDVPLAPVTPSSIRGSHTLPPGYTFLERVVALDFDDGTVFNLVGDDRGPEFSDVVPSGIDATIRLIATARGEGTTVTRRETGIAAGAIDVSLDLPRGAPIFAPADGTIGIDAQTDFSWGTFHCGIFTVVFSTPEPAPTLFLVTEDTHVFLPQLAELPVPGGTAYRWSVLAEAPFASVDEAAGPRLLTPAGNTLLQSHAESRIFVTR